MNLELPSCYTCKHNGVCSFVRRQQAVIEEHNGWIKPGTRHWEKFYEALAKACRHYEFREEK